MKRLGSILLWSAIAAAFIGPGTVTVAASTGASLGPALLWAILFSGIATFTLQEFAGRLAVTTGDDLATVLQRRYPTGFARVATVTLVGGAILLGCAAYEAGNILGGAAGAMLALDAPRGAVTLGLALAAGALLLSEAGAMISDRSGQPIRFNAPHPKHDGVVAANPALHGEILGRLRQAP